MRGAMGAAIAELSQHHASNARRKRNRTQTQLPYSLKLAAPISSPTARPMVPLLTAEYVEKTSGEPLPNAKKVTPAVDSDSPK